jgi:hypothetical protein
VACSQYKILRLRATEFASPPATIVCYKPLLPKEEPPALSRNKIDGHELEAEFSGLGVKPSRFLVMSTLLMLLKDGGVVWLLGCNHVKDDPGKLMGGSRHGLGCAHPGFHAAEVVSEETVAAV